MVSVLIRALVPCLAVLAGAIRYQRMDRSTRSVFFQVFAYMVVLTLVKQVMAYQRMNNLDLNTNIVYNIYLPLETFFLIQAAFFRFENKLFKMFLFTASALFITSFCIELFYKSPLQYCNYTDTFANITLSLVFGVLLFQEFRKEAFVWSSASFIWIVLGVFLFSASTATYMSIFDYLNRINPEMNRTVYRILFGVTANLKYALIALGFWLIPSRSSQIV